MYRNCDGIEFLKSLPDKSVDGIFTDPPWGGNYRKILGNDKYLYLMQEMNKELPRILKPWARVLIWWSIIRLPELFESIFTIKYKWMIFVKYIPTRYIARFQSCIDPIVFFAFEDDKLPMPEKSLPQVYNKPSTGKRDSGHPCARPIDICKKIIRDWFNPGEYIIDPFAGSDTVGVCARELNNPYDTCEIDPVMYEHGLRRNAQGFLFETINQVHG